MSGNIHLKQSAKGLWLKTLLLGAALFIFEMLFTLLGTSAQIKESMLKKMADIPPMVEKMFGKAFIEGLIKYGVIAIGYIHPFMLVIFILFIFITISGMVTSEINSGAIGFTLSKPLSRKRIYLNMAIIIYLGLGLLALSTFLSSFLGIKIFFSEPLSTGPFVSLAWNLYLVMLLIAGYIVIFASISDSGKMFFTIGGIVLLVFYILSFAAPLWKPLTIFDPMNPFAYYKPMELLIGSRIGFGKSLTLIGVSAVMFAVAAWIFNRRDISSG
ncbi:MAG: ABC transporter permease subunit [Candidatus Aminicenantes bacterium]|jgi:ABC-type transport system involved in multi-copper enzyme maturation permease subunit